MPLPPGLYVITDRGLSRGRSHEEVVAAALRGGAATIQLRDKACPRDELIATGQRLAKLCRDAGATFIVNDDPAVAAEIGAGGVHLGPEDPSPVQARAVLGAQAVIGYSAKASPELAREAEAAGADYVVAGSIFPTSTKENATVVGLAAIRGIKAAVSIQVAAIGGIGPANIASVIEAGAEVACVISAAVAAQDVEAACRDMVQRIRAAQAIYR
ncbi:MAG TPA: thiamine phosphate synthase [Chloroflexota bacterium]|nr:thiamine phosphate synthase [Chloroflexota bacterium]